VIGFIGALIDLLLRLIPTKKDQNESEIRKKRDQNKDRIDRIFSDRNGTSWWLR
jgi:hypothetical protein